ncbi:MAG TPA: T9SS type A sorting domain-containing protein [Rubricoccaceae bacterium]|nr:T9SS type A sorting domain-containing protein [Rubricoccaceae bacterium]
MRSATALCLLLVLAAPVARTQGTFEFLPIPSGFVDCFAHDVSASGDVITGICSRQDGQPEVFRWTQPTGTVPLGVPAGFLYCQGGYVSADGEVVAGYCYRAEGGDRRDRAFRWTQATGIVLLPVLAGYENGRCIAHNLSANGAVVVGSCEDEDEGLEARGFRWEGGVVVDLGDGPVAPLTATDLSGDGQVLVGSAVVTPGQGLEAYRKAGGVLMGLGDLPGGDDFSVASAVSPDGGVVVGWSASAASGSLNEAFRWTQATGMVALGDLPGGLFLSEAHSVSADGRLVAGWSESAGSPSAGFEAFLWTAERGMRRLYDALGEGLPQHPVPDGWRLVIAWVSADGQVVAGWARDLANPTREVAFRAVLAAPAEDIIVNETGDGADYDPGNGRCDADVTQAGEQCSLRAAIMEANGRGGGTITFDIPGGGIPRITIGETPLPAFTAPITIDGSTQPGGWVELSGPGLVPDELFVPGIEIGPGGGGSVVRGLVINGFRGSGVVLQAGANGCTIAGNRIGTDAAGTQARGNGTWNAQAAVQGAGVRVYSDFNLIAGNVLAGNFVFDSDVTYDAGAEVLLFEGAEGNRLEGNRIGVGAGGQVIVRSGTLIGDHPVVGVQVVGANATVVGLESGTGSPEACTGPCNLIAGHMIEVRIGAHPTLSVPAGMDNTVAGNYIGVDAAGNPQSPYGRQVGVQVTTLEEARVTVADNFVKAGHDGVSVEGHDHRILRNRVEGNAGEPSPEGSLNAAIELHGANHRVEGNAVRSLTAIGVLVFEGSGHVVTGNEITANPLGGVVLQRDPVSPPRAEITQNRTYGNRIGIDLNYDRVTRNDGGDTDSGPNDLLNYPELRAVAREGTNVRVEGLLLMPAFGEQVYRVEAFSSPQCSRTATRGAWRYGEGEHYLGASEVTTSFGNAAFAFTMPALPEGDQVVTLTATGLESHVTSEFSRCLPVVGAEQTARAEIGTDQTGLVLDGHGVAVTVTEPAGGAALHGGEEGTLFVTRYESRPDTSVYADASATSHSGSQVEPSAIAARYWYLADVGLTPDGGHEGSALRYGLCLDPAEVVVPERLGEVVLVQRNDSTGGLWMPLATTRAPHGSGEYLCAEGLAHFGEFSLGGDPSAFTDGGGPGGLPEAFALGAPYPNPAVGAMTVPYDVAEAGEVRLSVYDLLGREVARLVDGETDAGRYEAVLSAGGLASGVYVVHLTAGRFAGTRKVTLIR